MLKEQFKDFKSKISMILGTPFDFKEGLEINVGDFFFAAESGERWRFFGFFYVWFSSKVFVCGCVCGGGEPVSAFK